MTLSLFGGVNTIGGHINYGYLINPNSFMENVVGVSAGYNRFDYDIVLEYIQTSGTETVNIGGGHNSAFVGIFWKILLGGRLDITNKLFYGRANDTFSFDIESEQISESSNSFMWSTSIGYPMFIRRNR